ncbi:GGDEF domain-containing protein [Plastoroseomonas arctica]|uniref:diguanylate cyclase n=1 Tax=Plastoroseomonas arctica TaxID=1509237 RepID=A0AAF1JYT2_9PROT|nr:GGDEF domain-containing protein [Plastoroseomonas arctica]MBR0657199.1 diguanylate cyclase [Plastoroseomonas arctica]
MLTDQTLVTDAACAASLRDLAMRRLAPNGRNYSVWYEYHEGKNFALRHAIDQHLAAGATIDEAEMHALHGRFLCDAQQDRLLSENRLLAQGTLQEVVALLSRAAVEHSQSGHVIAEAGRSLAEDSSRLANVVTALLAETDAMSRRGEILGRRLDAATRQISGLEKRLSVARHEATVDPLTELLNRRAFDAALQRVTQQAAATKEPLAMLMVDVDRFKRINDSWGHPVGDAVLRVVANKLRQSSRDTDTVARYGGEEFVVLLPKAPLAEAMMVADRVRLAVCGRNLTLRDTGKVIGTVTVSAGVSIYRPGEPVADFLTRADEALIQAKQSGRNRVMTLEGAMA